MASFFERPGEQRFSAYADVIGLPGVLMFGAYNYHEAHPRLPAHQHPKSMEVVFLARGEQTYRVGGNYYRLRGGDQFVTFPDEWHDTGDFPEEKGLLFWVVIQPGGNFLNLPPAQVRALKQALGSLPSRHFQADREAEPLLREVLENLTRPVCDLTRLRVGAALLRYLLKTCEAASRSPRPTISTSIRRALEWIDEHPDDASPIKMLAQAANLSVPRFKTKFKQELGMPPREYVLRQKVKMARTLLQDHSVTATAFLLGFSTSQYFATVFRRFTGVTPSAFQSTTKAAAARSKRKRRKSPDSS